MKANVNYFYWICLLVLSLLQWKIDGFFFDNRFTPSPLRLAAFNVQSFSSSKMAEPEVARKLVLILSRYDVVLLQEVRDIEHKALELLLAQMKAEDDTTWTYISSIPLGRHGYKEQYVFFYKASKVAVISSYLVQDIQDTYEREPFAIRIKYPSVTRSENRQLILAGFHSKPLSAKLELNALDKTILELTSIWRGTDGVITMGDFNADCGYFARIHQESVNIFNASMGFKSLIAHDVDTTVKDNSDCAYDRIVVYGDDVDTRDAKVYDFQKALNMNLTEALEVSDHFPVEFRLY